MWKWLLREAEEPKHFSSLFPLPLSCVSGKHAQLLLTSNLLYGTEIACVLIQTPNCCTLLFSPTGPIITSHVLESGSFCGSLTWMTSLIFKKDISMGKSLLPSPALRKKTCLNKRLVNSCLVQQPSQSVVMHKFKRLMCMFLAMQSSICK